MMADHRTEGINLGIHPRSCVVMDAIIKSVVKRRATAMSENDNAELSRLDRYYQPGFENDFYLERPIRIDDSHIRLTHMNRKTGYVYPDCVIECPIYTMDQLVDRSVIPCKSYGDWDDFQTANQSSYWISVGTPPKLIRIGGEGNWTYYFIHIPSMLGGNEQKVVDLELIEFFNRNVWFEDQITPSLDDSQDPSKRVVTFKSVMLDKTYEIRVVNPLTDQGGVGHNTYPFQSRLINGVVVKENVKESCYDLSFYIPSEDAVFSPDTMIVKSDIDLYDINIVPKNYYTGDSLHVTAKTKHDHQYIAWGRVTISVPRRSDNKYVTYSIGLNKPVLQVDYSRFVIPRTPIEYEFFMDYSMMEFGHPEPIPSIRIPAIPYTDVSTGLGKSYLNATINGYYTNPTQNKDNLTFYPFKVYAEPEGDDELMYLQIYRDDDRYKRPVVIPMTKKKK
ncbi:hypothetical protein PQC06_gp084 [Aeromonas phage LAh10]|uniref:Uncharacterized protein n=1 Tax=Aeromonas phage LAh10 TaxID=2591025 RepID=A0A514A1A1_9CAUD|nr:hypothetical protein PQC06_gp084 [Aeromonas phage LAh10]QDH47057.1 hypothetical protein LAh10_84 [Aeromonas phage LAh10]